MLLFFWAINMVEKLKMLNDLSRTIIVINKEISEINENFSCVRQLRDSIIGNELENDLKNIENVFKANIKSRNEKKNKNEELFRKLMYDIFGIKIKFDGNCLVFESEKIYDSTLEEYKQLLRYYIELFNSVGISDDNLFVKLKNSIHKMLHIALKLCQFLKLVRESKIEYLEETNLLSMIAKHIDEYKDIIMKYRELLKILIANDKIPFNESSIQYIINNTSLLPLVFANNSYSLIRRGNSLKRLFLCQFHMEKTPSLRVGLDTNFFICYGCGKKGNQIEYLSQFHNISYTDAIYLLAEIFLIDLPKNPFREGQNAILVNKYREVLMSDDYTSFLTDSMNRSCKMNSDNENVYLTLFSQIERVKSVTWDSSFQFEQKSERFINFSENKSTVISLLPERTFSGFLPF